MISLIVTAIIILLIVMYVFKSILEETDYQTWLNIALVTIILLTVVLSIFMILNKASDTSTGNKTAPIKQEQQVQDKTAQKQNPEEISDDDLYVIIAENYLTLKRDYEAANKGIDGSTYAANEIIKEYDLTQEEWDDFYKKAIEKGHFKKAEENLKKQNVDYLIKK